jgi:hypothetical protein
MQSKEAGARFRIAVVRHEHRDRLPRVGDDDLLAAPHSA